MFHPGGLALTNLLPKGFESLGSLPGELIRDTFQICQAVVVARGGRIGQDQIPKGLKP